MNLEFHYYTTVYLALKAGFDRASALILGTSCQTVDTNVLNLTIQEDSGLRHIEPTQNYGYWDRETPARVYLPFHFFPGGRENPDNRRDGRRNFFSVCPNNSGVKHLLVRALKTGNLYRIGIALHTFADSWAHQNFSGLQEDWNSLGDNTLAPAVGHAQAGRSPDLWTETWTDSRLKQPAVRNLDRYAEAFRKIYRYLCLFNKQSYDDEDFVFWEWQDLLKRGQAGVSPSERMLDLRLTWDIPEFDRSSWLEAACLVKDKGWQDATLFEGYDKLLWLMDQFLFKTKLVRKEIFRARPNYLTSHFHQWQEAALAHRSEAHSLLDAMLPGWRRLIDQA